MEGERTGGAEGFRLGRVEVLRPRRDRDRATFRVVADSPVGGSGFWGSKCCIVGVISGSINAD